MNRQQRRAAAKKAKGRPIDRVVAVHEAGHAVGRFLIAPALGYAFEDSISHIDLHAEPMSLGPSLDGKMHMQSAATTYGPMFSQPLTKFLYGATDPREVTLREVACILSEARAAGLDVDGSFRAKAFSTVLGPMAEAKFLGRPFDDVVSEYGSEGDLRDIVKEGTLAGLTEEQILRVLDEVIALATHEIARPEVWRAILTLADSLKPGRTSGRKAVAIIAREIVVE